MVSNEFQDTLAKGSWGLVFSVLCPIKFEGAFTKTAKSAGRSNGCEQR